MKFPKLNVNPLGALSKILGSSHVHQSSGYCTCEHPNVSPHAIHQTKYDYSTAFEGHPRYGDIQIDVFSINQKKGYSIYWCQAMERLSQSSSQKNAMLVMKDYDDIDAPLIFVAACAYFLDYPELLEPGYATGSGGEIIDGSPLTSFYVTFPGNFGIPAMNSLSVLLIAITDEESKLLDEVGPEEFDRYLLENDIDLFDIKRN